MRFSAPASISFFCEFWSSIGYLYPSSVRRLRPYFFSFNRSILLQSQLCLSPHLWRGGARQVHTLVAGVVQVYHRLHVVEEEEKERKVEQEVEKEDQSEETAHTWMAMEMIWKTQTWAKVNVCVWRWRHDNLPERMRTTLSGCGCKCAHCEVPRKHRCCHWRSYRGVSRKHKCCHSHSRCASSPTHRFSTFLNFHFVPKFSSCCHAVTIHHHFYL